MANRKNSAILLSASITNAYPLQGYPVTYPMLNLSETGISVPDHPQYATRGTYLNHAPYTRRTLYGRYGTIPLDTAFFQSGDTITVRYNVDLITGHCRAIVERTRGIATDFIIEKRFLLAVPIQIAQVGTDYLGTYATAISTGATAGQQAMTLNVGGAISTLATGIYNTIQARVTSTQIWLFLQLQLNQIKQPVLWQQCLQQVWTQTTSLQKLTLNCVL